jgi:hypothetical protein
MKTPRLIHVFMASSLFLVPLVALAQEEGPMPLTWAGAMNLKPGADPLFEKAFETYEQPLLDRLVAENEGVSWGLGYELAGPGGFDYLVWVNAPGWAGIGEVEAVFDERWEGMSEDELAKMIEEWAAVIEPSDDPAYILRHVVVKANPDVQSNYLRLSNHTVKPGHGADLVKMYKSYWVPIYDELLESGVISAYGLIEQAVHSDSSFTHQIWFEFEDLANLDTIERAFEEAETEVSEGDGLARKLAFMKTVDPDAHFCRLIRKLKQGG